MQTPPSRDEIEQALLQTNCHIDIDAALASPTTARCLEIMVFEMRHQKNVKDIEEQKLAIQANNLLAKKLKKLMGNIDYQALRAGMSSED